MHNITDTQPGANAPAYFPKQAENTRWRSDFRVIQRKFSRSMRIATFCLLSYWILLFIGTHLPSAVVPRIQINDKILHFMAFGGLSFLLAWAIPTRNGRMLSHLLITLLLVTTYAAIDETTQKWIPGRQCCFYDFIADFLGATAGLGLYIVVRSVLKMTSSGSKLINLLSR